MSDTGAIFIYDYVDPLSYLFFRGLQRVEEETGLEVEAIPLEVTPPSTPLLDPEGQEYRALWARAERVGSPHMRELARPWIVPWSRKAHELAAHARERDCFREIHETLFRAYLIEGRDIGRIDILVELGRKAGLDPMETKAVLDVDRHAGVVEEARERARAAGCSSPPVLFWKGATYHGDPGPEALKQFFSS